MNTNDVRAVARRRANRRLTRLTIGTAILGVVATGTLGWVAAATSQASSPSSGQSASLFTSSLSLSGIFGAAPAVTKGSGPAHVSTGGS